MILEKLYDLFIDKQEAWSFIRLWLNYVNNIDDLIDEKFDAEKFIHLLYLSSLLHSSNYYLKYRSEFLAIEANVANEYADSIKWENGTEEQKKFSDIIRHCGLQMILTVVRLELGWNALRSISPIIREEILKS